MAILKPTLPGIMRPAVLGTVEASFTDTCAIGRPTDGVDANGENTVVWTTVAEVPCRLTMDRRNAVNADIGQKETNRTYYRLFVPVGTDAQDGDRVQINGEMYEVLRIIVGLTDALYTEIALVRFSE